METMAKMLVLQSMAYSLHKAVNPAYCQSYGRDTAAAGFMGKTRQRELENNFEPPVLTLRATIKTFRIGL